MHGHGDVGGDLNAAAGDDHSDEVDIDPSGVGHAPPHVVYLRLVEISNDAGHVERERQHGGSKLPAVTR